MAHTKPTPNDLKLRYPAFVDVDGTVVQYWLTDAERSVDESWSETDYAPGLNALAAHSMVMAGVPGVSGGAVAGMAAAGVTSFRSGSFSASISEIVASAAADDDYKATRYGREYLRLLQRRGIGARTTGPGIVPAPDGYCYPHGEA